MSEMLIGGEWRQATAHEQLDVVNPATEDVVDRVPAGSPDDVELAVETELPAVTCCSNQACSTLTEMRSDRPTRIEGRLPSARSL